MRKLKPVQIFTAAQPANSLTAVFYKKTDKKAKIADLSFCFEFQVVVVVVGFKWHS